MRQCASRWLCNRRSQTTLCKSQSHCSLALHVAGQTRMCVKLLLMNRITRMGTSSDHHARRKQQFSLWRNTAHIVGARRVSPAVPQVRHRDCCATGETTGAVPTTRIAALSPRGLTAAACRPYLSAQLARVRSSAGEHSLHTRGVAGSIPAAPTRLARPHPLMIMCSGP